jgi:hypothetical protein
MKITGNEPSNPFFKWNEAGYGDCIVIYSENGSKQFIPYQEGLTIRQHFASMAMQSLILDKGMTEEKTPKEIAHIATIYADGLIAELNETEK